MPAPVQENGTAGNILLNRRVRRPMMVMVTRYVPGGERCKNALVAEVDVIVFPMAVVVIAVLGTLRVMELVLLRPATVMRIVLPTKFVIIPERVPRSVIRSVNAAATTASHFLAFLRRTRICVLPDRSLTLPVQQAPIIGPGIAMALDLLPTTLHVPLALVFLPPLIVAQAK